MHSTLLSPHPLSGSRAVTSADVRPSWFACYTRGRHEKRVDTHFRQRGMEAYLPTGSFLRRWKDRRRTLELPLFPSYLFVRFAPRDLSSVLKVYGVVTVVRIAGKLAPVPDAEIKNIRRFAAALGTTEAAPEVVPFLAEGEWVRIRGGPFDGVDGVVVELRGRSRVLVGLRAIGLAFPVDVDAASLDPIPVPGAAPDAALP